MIIYKCDMCGSEMNPNEDRGAFEHIETVSQLIGNEPKEGQKTTGYILCGKCAETVDKYICQLTEKK